MKKFKIPIFLILSFYSFALYAQPTITQQPSNQSAAVGATAMFSVTASSASAISYQWFKNSIIISGANQATYTTPAVTLSDNGTVFYCVVADSNGFVQSNNATLLVGESPVITVNPSNLTVTESESAMFSITATGTAPLNYQWRKNGTNIPGATSNSFTLANANVSDNGSTFSCVVTNNFGISISNTATLTVNAGEAPVITIQPEDQAVLTGQAATFSLSVSGSTPMAYQWKKNGTNISGANSSSYTTPATILSDNGSTFTCEISNNFGTIVSVQAKLYVTSSSSRVTANLQVLYEFEEGEGDIIHDVSNNGTPEDITIITPDKVAWTPNGLETFSSTIRKVSVDSKIRASCQSSDEITLEVWIQPEFVYQNSRRIFTYSLSGDFRNFSVISTGDHYEFRLTTDSTSLNGLPSITSSAGTQKLGLTHLVYTHNKNGNSKVYVDGQLDNEGYIPGSLDRFKDYCYLAIGSEPLGGNEWRGQFYLAAVYNRALSETEVQHNYQIGTPVDRKPAYTIQPKDKYVVEGESILLDSYAVSVLPLTYQWKKNGVNIPGATDRKLNIANVGALDNGAVFVSTATTSAGTTVSNSATVYVTGLSERANDGIKTLYTFREGTGNIINDVSGVGSPLNVNIFDSEAINWEKGGLRILSEPSILTTNSATKITNALKTTNALSVEAWVSSSNLNQASPARIFTISADENNRNLSLGQNNDSYEINLRTTVTNDNGIPKVGSSAGTVSADGYDHIVFTRASNGTVKFYINGTERVSTTLSGDLSNWNDIYLLSIGNEFGTDNHWEGLINLIAIFDRPLTNSEVLRNYNFGPFGVVYEPTNVTLISNDIGAITFGWSDNSSNEEGFKIERGVGNPVVYTQIGIVGKDSTIFTDENIVDNTVYQYRVKAYNSIGESEYSDILVVKSLISPIEVPSGLDYSLDTDGYPIITWIDNSDNETNFVIERRKTGLGSEFSIIDTVEQNITSYKDMGVSELSTYVYKIMAYNNDTSSVYSSELFVEVQTIVGVDEMGEIPSEYSLAQNYPNPFNPSTTINFGLPENAEVSLIIYNLLGQQVIKVVDKEFSAGHHKLNIKSDKLTSGVYIYAINAKGINGKNFSQTKKMILIK